MTMTATITGSSASTIHALIEPPHQFVEMHHYDEDGAHYCPTGFAMCTGIHDGVQTPCDEVRSFEGDCRLWGRSP